jgi:hypothetical protein
MYAAAADAVNDRFPNALHVLSHLLGMSIELALKAYLLKSGASKRILRRLGHDLHGLLKSAEATGFTYAGSRSFRLAVLGQTYMQRGFAYPAEAILDVIMPWSLRQIAREILEEAFTEIKGAAMYEEMRKLPGLIVASEYPDDLNASAWADQRINVGGSRGQTFP